MTIKQRLLASVMTLMLGASQPAHALFGVGDIVFDPTNYAEMVAQAQQLAQQLAVLRQQYVQLQQTYYAVAHLPDTVLQELAGQLNRPEFRSPLPGTSGLLRDLMAGNSLGNVAMGYLDRNTRYPMSGLDSNALQMGGVARSVAGVQGLLDGLYQSVAGRMTVLQALEQQLATAPDAKAVADIQARLATEQTYLQGQQVQASALNTWQGSQVRIDDVQREEIRRCQIDAVLADRRAKRSLGTTGEDCGRQVAQQQPGGMTVGTTPNGTPVVTAMAGGGQGGGAALDRMLQQSWGQQASDNATALGVSPAALAATAQVESNFQNVDARSGSTIRGVFQVKDSTFTEAARAAGLSTDLSGQMNPAVQSAAAAQVMRSAAESLQRGGMASPDLIAVRSVYQWGAGAGPELARSLDSRLMADALPGYSASVLASNGIRPGQTVGEYRANLERQLGPAARQPVLLGVRNT